MSITIQEKRKKKRLVDIIPFRSEVEEDEWIVGPFGIWPWPLLNVLVQLIKRLRTIGRTTVAKRRKRLAITELVRDEYGRIIQVVEREIEE